jgi:Transposase
MHRPSISRRRSISPSLTIDISIAITWGGFIKKCDADYPEGSEYAAIAAVASTIAWGRRKNDRIDAAAAACMAALQGDVRTVTPEGHVDALGMLDERRNNLTQNSTRAVNQLHGSRMQLVQEASRQAAGGARSPLPSLRRVLRAPGCGGCWPEGVRSQ